VIFDKVGKYYLSICSPSDKLDPLMLWVSYWGNLAKPPISRANPGKKAGEPARQAGFIPLLKSITGKKGQDTMHRSASHLNLQLRDDLFKVQCSNII
jgi:hypothetical protein